MRQIKFRAWDIVQNKMLSWEQLCNQCWNLLTNINDGIIDNNNWIYQQYTNLKDKNGKEIFEGDILRHHKGGTPFKIAYSEKLGAFISEGILHQWSEFISERNIIEEYEIIGNIYEHQNLLN